jgi:hypothetical protein
MPAQQIFLLTCVAEKRPDACAASELYIGPDFIQNMEYVATQKADAVYILSGKHHLLKLDAIILPYDLLLDDLPIAAQQAWANTVTSQLSKLSDLQNDRFNILATSTYRRFITPQLKHWSVPDFWEHR